MLDKSNTIWPDKDFKLNFIIINYIKTILENSFF